MRTGKWLVRAGLAMVSFFALLPAWAQEPGKLPPAGDAPPPAPPVGAAPPIAAGAVHGGIQDANEPVGILEHCGAFEDCDLLAGTVVFRGEYLYEKPHRSALDFAIIDGNSNGLPQGVVQSVDWKADSGLRVGGAYRLSPEGWEIGTYYTYFHSSAHDYAAAAPGGTLYATLTHPGFVDAVNTATATSSLNYNIVDLELGKRGCWGKSFTYYLAAGGRYSWIDQNLDVIYNGQSANLDEVSSPIHFDGGGVRVGGEGELTLGWGLGIFAKAYGSMLVGNFHTGLLEANNGGQSVITNVVQGYRRVVPVAEFGLGLSYQYEHLHARIGYELTDWIGMVQSPDFVHDFSNKLSQRTGDLSLDGLTVEFEYSF